MMKIMFIAMASSVHTIKWVNYFRDIGAEIMLVSFYPSDEIKGVDFRYIPCRNKNMAVLKVPRVKKLLKEFQPDIVHAHHVSSCGLVGALLNFHPFIVSVWGYDVLIFPHKSFLHKLSVKYTGCRHL